MDSQELLTIWQEFQWLRPFWLLGIPISLLAIALLWRGQQRRGNWKQIIAPELLPHLLEGKLQKQQKLPLIGLLAGWILTCLALAGPTWEKIPQPIHKTESALVVLLDLSPSMHAEDLKPSRLVRARLKLIDLLKERKEGLTALIAYGGEAHIITPLTDDTQTLISLLPALSPDIMPLQGSNTEMAVELGLQLLADAGLQRGELLLITDGVEQPAVKSISNTLTSAYRLSVLGVGTDAGAPIPIRQGGFAKQDGAIVVAKLVSRNLKSLAQDNGGIFRLLSATDTDLSALTAQPDMMDKRTRELERQFDIWFERGPYLALFLLPFVAFAFRRGWAAAMAVVMFSAGTLTPQTSYAFGWDDLWQRKDQQGQKLLEQEQPQAAAEAFEDSQWKASAHYKNGDYNKAAELYGQEDSAKAHYNRGNALAKQQQFDQAIEAYKQALQLDPEHPDAQTNKELVEQLKQQQEQQQNQQGQGQNQDQNQQNQDQQDQGQQGQNQESQDQKNKQNQQGQDQQNQGQQQSSNDQKQENQQQDNQSQQQNGQTDQQREQTQQQKQQANESQQDKTEQQQGQQPQETTPAEEQQANEQQMAAQETGEQSESDQALEQWLRKVPDDPSGLMKRKLQYQHNLRRKQYRAGTWEPPENEANKRW
ncbi:hypothetical protein R50073_26180 [Maricurvus nonylphenolicus]|uniref:vWA domain-containing protein n=1 Tax=Maricurvus nonylphenolicus TaxID=1008307 RepID=UPI0036F3FB78